MNIESYINLLDAKAKRRKDLRDLLTILEGKQ